MLSSGATQFTSEHRFMSVNCSLGEDVLFVKSLRGQEGLSELPLIHLDILSYKESLDPLELIGELLLVKIDHKDSDIKELSGYVCEFEYIGPYFRGMYSYSVSIVPWFWFLKNRINSRVYQNETLEEIFTKVCEIYDFANFSFSLTEELQKIPYCVQYEESDFNFLSRLMEKLGLFYYFSYESKRHVMHIVDTNSKLELLEDTEVTNLLDGTSKLRDWRHRYRYCSTKISVNDFDFEKPNHKLLTETSSVLKLKNGDNLARYMYARDFKENDQGEKIARVLMEENETRFNAITATSENKAMALGKRFTYRLREGGQDNGKDFVIRRIEHEAIDNSFIPDNNDANVYRNKLECFSDKQQFRAATVTPKPRIDGVQTAIVVGKTGDEIYTDDYGRIKIQFHWDLYGEKNEKSSCWVRVSTPWAGSKWGTIATPRVGQEVIVTFEEGDPDRPLVLGGVYNNTHMPPYVGQKNVAGMKSRSSKGGDKSTYNEFSFDDTKGEEKVTLNAQKDFNASVGNNSSTSVTASASTSTGANYSVTVGEDASETVTGKKTVKVDGLEEVTIGEDSTKTITGKMNITANKGSAINVSGGETTITFSDGMTQTINKDTTINRKKSTLTVDGDDSYHVTGKQTLKVDGAQLIHGKSVDLFADNANTISGKTLDISADDSVKISVGGNSIEISKTGITISSGTSVGISVGGSSVTVDNVGVKSSGPIIKVN